MSTALHLRAILGRGRSLLGELVGVTVAREHSQTSPFDVFLAPNALAINKARQEARTQPDHADFPTDWDYPPTQLFYRAVFVGSKVPRALDILTGAIPRRQPNLRAA